MSPSGDALVERSSVGAGTGVKRNDIIKTFCRWPKLETEEECAGTFQSVRAQLGRKPAERAAHRAALPILA